MLSGQPIGTKKQDIFERSAFADLIADLLVLPEKSASIAIALEGVWGSGKTSTINLIKEKLIGKPEGVVVVDFNPWLIGSLDSVIEGFLVQFASAINHKLRSDTATQAAGKLLNFARFLAPIKLIPGVEPWGTLVENTLKAVGDSVKSAVDMTELDLSRRKQAVWDAIDELGKPIVVVIDDIDRCPPEEVRTIFQVIKAICDFNRVSYLLAYDPEPIIKCLEYDGTYDGQRYLEKIVQASYPLPRIGYWHLKKFLNRYLDQLQERLGLKLNSAEKDLLVQALDTTAIVRSLSTPRDVIRLINRLLISAKNTAGEVNFTDVVAFETLELKYSNISHAIRRNPEIFLATSVLEGDLIGQDFLNEMTNVFNEEQKGGNPYVQNLLKDFDEKDKKNIRSILGFLFPTVFEELTPYSAEQAAFNNRVSTKEALLKLLHSGPTRYTFSSEEIKHFLQSTVDRREILMDFLEAGALPGWLRYVEQFVSFSEISNPVLMCKELLIIGRNAFTEKRLNLTDEIGRLILSILKSEKNLDRRSEIIKSISSNKISLSVSEDVILRLLSDCNMWVKGVYKGIQDESEYDIKRCIFEPSELIEIKDTWIRTVRNVAETEGIFAAEPEPISILFRWGQLNNNNFAEVQEYVASFTEDDQGIQDFLNCFLEGKGVSGVEKLIREIPSFICKIQRIEKLPQATSRFIDYLSQVEKDKTNSEP